MTGFRDFPTIEDFATRVAFTSIVTLIFQYVPHKWFLENSLVWLYLKSEYLISYCYDHVIFMNHLHSDKGHGGNILLVIIGLILNAHGSMAPSLMEDLLYKDLNLFKVDVIPTSYFPIVMATAFMYLQQIYCGNSLSLEYEETFGLRVKGYQADLDSKNKEHLCFFDLMTISYSIYFVVGLVEDHVSINK